MVSYAQNGEDVVLRRAFKDRQGAGFYVDVGACHPEDDNVTHTFYEQGWRGINVEPDPDLFKLFVDARPRDANVNAAIGGERGRAEFFPIGVRGHGTLDAGSAAQRGDGGRALRVPVMTLGDLLDMYGPDDGHIDFLKVDVEGWEERVLQGVDWSRHRPVVVLIEAVDPGGVPTHAAWEVGLVAGGYRFALFDGLNRFYCRDEDAERMLPILAAPASVLDQWTRKSEFAAHAGAAQRAAEAEQAASDRARLRRTSELAEARSAALGQDTEEARARLRASEADLAAAKAEATSLSARAADLDAALARARGAAARADAAHLADLDAARAATAQAEAARFASVEVVLRRARDSEAQAHRREETAEASLAEMEVKVQMAVETARTSDADLGRAIAAVYAEEIDSAAHADMSEHARAALSEHLARHAAEIAGLRADNARLLAWREAVRTSTSWRVTRPIRGVLRFARGIPRNG